jgi:two-component system phosphate regulon response regulator PhoB
MAHPVLRRSSGQVLVVDDEPDVCRLLSFNLEQEGFEIDIATTGAAAFLAAGRCPPAVVVLDVMLPDLSGVEICRQLRADPALADVGILMLTALGGDGDRIGGLEAGADDYVVKPFNVKEVVLRVRALARRVGERREARVQPPGSLLRCGDLAVDPTTHDVRAAGVPLELRPLEFKILVTLLAEPGRVFSRADLLRDVWDLEAGGNPRTVDVHIRRLRQNLGECAEVIETVPGFGYRARGSEKP